jgi:hypothetical protein
MLYFVLGLVVAGGGIYAWLRYGKYVLAAWAWLKAKFGAVKKVV